MRLNGKDLNEWRDAVTEWADTKGWNTSDITDHEVLGSIIALIHSEASEALECVRDDDLEMRFDEGGKPLGLPSELADIIIRVVHLSGRLGIDIANAVSVKHEYNKTRQHRHGGKKL